jgi:thymidine kinase
MTTLSHPVPTPAVGHLTVVAGPMFSGKSTELLRLVRRARIARAQVQLFKSRLDTRYAGVGMVCSHAGESHDAISVRSAAEIERAVTAGTHVVAIDEVQFLDADIVPAITRLAARGIRIVVAGLDLDFRGEVFGVMGTLMAVAERVEKLTAVCLVCGGEATRTQRIVAGAPAPSDGPTVLVGAAECYEARCRMHHEVPA